MGKFHPDDLRNPLYEHSQVVTVYELQVIYQGLAAQYHHSKWWQFRHRYNLSIAGHAVYELLAWLHDGKPALIKHGEINENYK